MYEYVHCTMYILRYRTSLVHKGPQERICAECSARSLMFETREQNSVKLTLKWDRQSRSPGIRKSLLLPPLLLGIPTPNSPVVGSSNTKPGPIPISPGLGAGLNVCLFVQFCTTEPGVTLSRGTQHRYQQITYCA